MKLTVNASMTNLEGRFIVVIFWILVHDQLIRHIVTFECVLVLFIVNQIEHIVHAIAHIVRLELNGPLQVLAGSRILFQFAADPPIEPIHILANHIGIRFLIVHRAPSTRGRGGGARGGGGRIGLAADPTKQFWFLITMAIAIPVMVTIGGGRGEVIVPMVFVEAVLELAECALILLVDPQQIGVLVADEVIIGVLVESVFVDVLRLLVPLQPPQDARIIPNVFIVGLLQLQRHAVVPLCGFVVVEASLVDEAAVKMVERLEIERLEIEDLFAERKGRDPLFGLHRALELGAEFARSIRLFLPMQVVR